MPRWYAFIDGTDIVGSWTSEHGGSVFGIESPFDPGINTWEVVEDTLDEVELGVGLDSSSGIVYGAHIMEAGTYAFTISGVLGVSPPFDEFSDVFAAFGVRIWSETGYIFELPQDAVFVTTRYTDFTTAHAGDIVTASGTFGLTGPGRAIGYITGELGGADFEIHAPCYWEITLLETTAQNYIGQIGT